MIKLSTDVKWNKKGILKTFVNRLISNELLRKFKIFKNLEFLEFLVYRRKIFWENFIFWFSMKEKWRRSPNNFFLRLFSNNNLRLKIFSLAHCTSIGLPSFGPMQLRVKSIYKEVFAWPKIITGRGRSNFFQTHDQFKKLLSF